MLLPRVARQLEAQIRANLNDREQLLGSLRAYLMLNLAERRDAAFLKDWLAADWSLRHPGNAVAQQGLNTHFARLLEESFAAYQLNDNLVAKAALSCAANRWRPWCTACCAIRRATFPTTG